jgi:tRNA G46 methylase TrmB
MAVDRARWRPVPSRRRVDPDHPERVVHAVGGSLILDQPAFADVRAALDAFVAPGPPLAVEVGFDHGINLLAHARDFPGWRWLGVELRRARVRAVADNAPPNCLPLRLDARTLFAAALPAGRVQRVDILFPTPVLRPGHTIFTEAFVADLARALAPAGVLRVMTDVPALDAQICALLAGWRPSAPPPRSAALSRRERVCLRDGVAFSERCFRPR